MSACVSLDELREKVIAVVWAAVDAAAQREGQSAEPGSAYGDIAQEHEASVCALFAGFEAAEPAPKTGTTQAPPPPDFQTEFLRAVAKHDELRYVGPVTPEPEPVDWSAFDGLPELVVHCKCGANYVSHTACVRDDPATAARPMDAAKFHVVTRKPCPSCGACDGNARNVLSERDAMRKPKGKPGTRRRS